MGHEDREAAMAALYEEYAGTRVLAKLAEGRRLVRGHGLLPSPLMVVGEAPGEQEERRGRPFVGPAGTLLQELFGEAGVPWEYCYVANVLPWRPPGNRTPYPFEVQASRPRLAAEVTLADPVVIVAAGSVAWSGLTAGADLGPFEDARFRWHDLNGRRLVAIPHPSAILRLKDAEAPEWKKATVEALRLALPRATA